MSKQNDDRTPQEWRELLRATYDYPEPPPDAGRRQRRRLRKAHRKHERAQAKEIIERERRREPLTAGGALILVLLLLALGIAGKLLFANNSADTKAGPHASHSAPQDDARPADPPASTTPTPSPTASTPLTDPAAVAEAWTRHYLTRNPPEDQSPKASVRRAAKWATQELTQNLLATDDPSWGKLVSRGGVATVKSVLVAPAGGDLPPDTPLRVWRTAKAQVSVKGYTDYAEVRTLQVELMRHGGRWLVSRVLGL